MKRLTAVALVVLGSAIPVCAQHHAGGGGFASHSAPAFHGGSTARPAPSFRGSFGAPSANRFAGPMRFAPGRPGFPAARPMRAAPGFQRGYPGNRGYRAGGLGGWDRGGHRRAYVPLWWPSYSTGYWIGPGYPTVLDYGDGYDSDAAAQPYGPGDYYDQGQQGYPYGYGDVGPDSQGPYANPNQGPYLGPWPSSPAAPPAASTQPQPTSETPQQTITLVFKDGRPDEYVRNYVLTPTTIYTDDGFHHQIPLDQIDMTATTKANQERGIDFELPRDSN